MTDEVPTNDITDDVAVYLPEKYNHAYVIPHIGNDIDWKVDFRFDGFRTSERYGSDIDCQELYELLCQWFNGGVSFIDTYMNEVFPDTAVYAEIKDIVDSLSVNLKKELSNREAKVKEYGELKDSYGELVKFWENESNRHGHSYNEADAALSDYLYDLDSYFDEYTSISDAGGLVYRKNGELDWRYKANKEYMYALRSLRELNERRYRNRTYEGDVLGSLRDIGDRKYSGFLDYIRYDVNNAVNEYNVYGKMYLNDAKKLSESMYERSKMERYSSIANTQLSDFDTFKTARFESEAQYLSEQIKDDIIMSLATGLIPLQNPNLAGSTLIKRMKSGIFGDNKFYATGQLINSIQIVITLSDRKIEETA